MAKPPTPGPPAGSSAGRRSVAAARKTKPGADRTQLLIGGAAVVVIVVIIVVGLILNANQGASTSSYGASQGSVATVSPEGVITVGAGGSKATLDFYEDGMCPYCALFEQQFGQQINEAVDKGQLTVRYHMLDFLNANSASKDYSTRASAALMCVAGDPATPKGKFLAYLENLFASGTQPAEKGTSDLSNAQLAELATKNGAGSAAAGCITSAKNIPLAKSSSAAGQAELTAALGSSWGTPSVLRDGKAADINTKDWLTTILA